MRGLIRVLLNFLSCRRKMSSTSIVIGMIIFFGGNYIILRSMFAGNYTDTTKVGHRVEEDLIVKQTVYHNNKKDNKIREIGH